LKLIDVEISSLKPHPQNYNKHPEEQIEHLKHSLSEYGQFRNIVISADGYILAGHGIVQAAIELGIEKMKAIKIALKHDDVRALKILVLDNEVSHLREQDTRSLTEILKEISESDVVEMLGTGYDEAMLAALAMASRPIDEIKNFDAAAEWAGMPEFEPYGKENIVTVRFRNDDDRKKFSILIGQDITGKKSIWYPAREIDDLDSVNIE